MGSIREPEIDRGKDGEVERLRIVFGPHYFIELDAGPEGAVELRLGFTHHGFSADASAVNGQLEEIISEVRDKHPDLLVD